MHDNNYDVGVEDLSKTSAFKREVLRAIIKYGELSITDVSRETNASIPTVTKFIGELMDEGLVTDIGKVRMGGRRKPAIYALNSAIGYIVGVDVRSSEVYMGIMNFKGEMKKTKIVDFKATNTMESLNSLCDLVKEFMENSEVETKEIVAVSLSLSGRVDSAAGFSYTLYSFGEQSVVDIMASKLGVRVFVENDSRAMVYGEYMVGSGRGEDTFIFANLSWGFGIGMIINGKLFYGKSGFSGEYGHIPNTGNDILCQCGKLGCIETEVSGWATCRLVAERLHSGHLSVLTEKYEATGQITLDDLMDAACDEDTLAIEVVETIGMSLGKAVSGLINIFNPETIVIGGSMTPVIDYLMSALNGAVKKYSLRLVSRDTVIRAATLGEDAAMIGACLIARSKILGVL